MTVAESATLSLPFGQGLKEEIHVFESPWEFAEWFDNNPVPDPGWGPRVKDVWNKNRPSTRHYSSTKGQYNCAETFEQALGLLKSGWHEGMTKMLDWQGAVQTALARKVDVPHFKLGEDGSDVEMGRFMMGEPEHMVGYGTTDTAKLSPIILVENNQSCYRCEGRACDHSPVKPDWGMMRGAVLFLLIKLMRQSGMYPEVWLGTSALYGTQTHSQVMGAQWARDEYASAGLRTFDTMGYRLARPFEARKRSTLIKALGPDSFFDPAIMAFVLAHDSMTRRLQFRFEETLNYREVGVFPTFVNDNRGQRLTYSQHPLEAGMLPMGGLRDGHRSLEVQPRWDEVVSRADHRSVILLPSYAALQDSYHHGRQEGEHEAAGAAMGAFGGPEQAAEYLLNVLEEAGVRLA